MKHPKSLIAGYLLLITLATQTSGFATSPRKSPTSHLLPSTLLRNSKNPREESNVSRAAATSSSEDDSSQATKKTESEFSTSSSLVANKEDYYLEIGYQDYFDGTKPDSGWNLAINNFVRQGRTILQQGLETIGIAKKDPLLPPQCLGLILDNAAVIEAETQREARGERVDVHPVSRTLYDVGCYFLDNLFEDRPIPRFWFLETIARIPYFSYVSMLHLYESFGWFRAVELRKVHAAEDWNELHHLLIMESLGGNALWSDRFLGYHVALLYYWALVVTYLASPRIAYQFMALLEAHAVDTYSTFCQQNKERLKQLPPPSVAKSYYQTGDLYLFDDFQVSRQPGSRRPPCDNLYDVFSNICIDEGEHVKTMIACQDYAVTGTKVVSPHLLYLDETNGLEEEEDEESRTAEEARRRKQWQEWSDWVNDDNDDKTTIMPNELDGYNEM